MRILLLVTCLYKDYGFPYFPPSFEWYQVNAGYLSKPLFKSHTTLNLLPLFDPAEPINTCGVRNFSIESLDFGYYKRHWTTQYCVRTFRLRLVNAFALIFLF